MCNNAIYRVATMSNRYNKWIKRTERQRETIAKEIERAIQKVTRGEEESFGSLWLFFRRLSSKSKSDYVFLKLRVLCVSKSKIPAISVLDGFFSIFSKRTTAVLRTPSSRGIPRPPAPPSNEKGGKVEKKRKEESVQRLTSAERLKWKGRDVIGPRTAFSGSYSPLVLFFSFPLWGFFFCFRCCICLYFSKYV